MDKKSYEGIPDIVYVREIKRGKTILVTTLLDSKKYLKNETHDLYREHWQMEF